MDRSQIAARQSAESGGMSDNRELAARLEAALADFADIDRELRSIGIVQKDLLGSRTEQDVASTVSEALCHHFGAFFARVWLTRPADICPRCVLADYCPEKRKCLHLIASSGFYSHLDGAHARVPLGAFKIGLIAEGRGKTISNDVPNDERVHNRDWARQHGLQAFAGFPVVLDGRVAGVIAMFSQSRLPEHLLTTLELLANLTASALEIVQRFRMEVELQRARRLESVGQLAAGIAHELNSPMQFISDNLEYIDSCVGELLEMADTHERVLAQADRPDEWQARRQESASPAKRTRLDQIKTQLPEAVAESREGGERVLEIVRAMRQFSYSGAEDVTEMDLNEAIRSILVITRSRWTNVADVETTLDPQLSAVPAYSAEINQTLFHLVTNAADAIVEKSGPGPQVKGRISVRSRDETDHVVVEVEDTGCGIPEGLRSRIFDPFFTTKEVGKGTGQGLTMCHDVVVNKHFGSIDFDSTLGVGSCFRVRLPKAGARCAAGSGLAGQAGRSIAQRADSQTSA